MNKFVETGLVVGHNDKPLWWHAPNDASSGLLPDSRALWEFFSSNWKDIKGFAHTHPEGCEGPSWTDITTFAAIELGLDLRFEWWIVTEKTVLVTWKGPGRHDYSCDEIEETLWAQELRNKSHL